MSATRHNLKALQVDLRNSGDTAGTRDRVVGYGAYIFSQ
jgi:MEMO1 family protein